MPKNIAFTSPPKKTNFESEWETAWKRFRQKDNNTKALELASDDIEKQESLIPPSPGLVFDRISHRWKRPVQHLLSPYEQSHPWKCPIEGKRFEDMEEFSKHKKGAHGIDIHEETPRMKKLKEWLKHRGPRR